MMKIELLFDLDGTISDPLTGIANCINYALESYGYQSYPHSALAQYIGPPLDRTFAALVDNSDEQVILQLYQLQ